LISFKEYIINQVPIIGKIKALNLYIDKNNYQAHKDIVSFEKAIDKVQEIKSKAKANCLSGVFNLSDLSNVPEAIHD